MPKYRRSRTALVGVLLVALLGLSSVDYTVERGDTLGDIARDQGVSLADLVDANDIANANLIYPGQVLVIPGDETEPDVVHIVVRGETLNAIASRYSSTVSVLVERNAISNPNLIRIGQNIVISGSVTSATSRSQTSTTSSVRSGAYHIVQRGENLDSIAAQHSGVSANQIAAANGVVDWIVYTNTKLFLDGPSFLAEGTEGESTYVVKSGDRLGDIAASHDTTTSVLVSLNKISNPNLIRSGESLLIPTGTTWVCPVGDSSFFNDWGFSRGGGTRHHEGNDLFVPYGSPVYAPVSGTVIHKVGSIGGNQFNLIGDDGVEYLGSHMSAFGKSGVVRAGDILGYVGTSGNAAGTSPHLHFGIYLEDGELAVNPYPSLLKYDCKR